MSRAKTQRPKRKPPLADKRRPSSVVATDPFERVEEALDALDEDDHEPHAHTLTDPEPPVAGRASRIRVPFPAKPRELSVGETVADDLVVEVEDLPQLQALAIAIHDPHVTPAQRAIEAAGHTVHAGASGTAGLDLIKAALLSGSVDAVLVGIPGGESLIDAALALAPRRPVVIAGCAGPATDAVRRAIEAGADLVAVRPYDVERLAPVLLAASRLVERREAIRDEGAHDNNANDASLRARLDEPVEFEAGTLQPLELFQRVLERELERARHHESPLALALFAVDIEPPEPPPGVRGILRARAGNALIQSIRDSDLATELDHERFLVLLPHTELGDAAEVARQIITAVLDGDPVIAAGRTFPVQIVGAVSGAVAGQPLSFARLMHDATSMLEQARRDGAELAVQS